jgi:hypothetical protein
MVGSGLGNLASIGMSAYSGGSDIDKGIAPGLISSSKDEVNSWSTSPYSKPSINPDYKPKYRG